MNMVNRIPVEPFRQVVNPLLAQWDADLNDWADGKPAKKAISFVSEALGIKLDTLENTLWGRAKTVDFDLADRILIMLGVAPNAWYSEPLAEHYWTCELGVNSNYSPPKTWASAVLDGDRDRRNARRNARRRANGSW